MSNIPESREEEDDNHFRYIIIGGGIAGVTCAETISQLCTEEKILLLSASPLIKAITNFRKVTKTLEEFDVEERPMHNLQARCPNVVVRHTAVTHLNSQSKEVETCDGDKLTYDKLCICTGGTPKLIAEDNQYVLGIRDTETVKVFSEKLKTARRVVIVGNGGIATELVYEIEGCEIIWAIKDDCISSTFVDAGAAEFFLPALSCDKHRQNGPVKRLKYRYGDDVSRSDAGMVLGTALGPDWAENLHMVGLQPVSHRIHVEYKVEINQLLTPQDVIDAKLTPQNLPDKSTSSSSSSTSTTSSSTSTTSSTSISSLSTSTSSSSNSTSSSSTSTSSSSTSTSSSTAVPSDKSSEFSQDCWPVFVELTNGRVYGCDFVVSATGVIPNVKAFISDTNKFDISDDGGFKVNDKMRTSVPDVYAAGDSCTAAWDHAPHWIQMRLWSQARQMGHYAAKCMIADIKGEDVLMDFCFELFAHATKFFNYKVVLLGLFNGQGLGKDHELMVRVTKGMEYVKVVMKDGMMQGAVLIGDTDLEETFENLILNKMDLSVYGEDLLDPNIDIEDYFD